MTVVVGFAGFFMLPDYPNQPNPRAFWFTSEHAQMARERLERHDRAPAVRITWVGAKYVLVPHALGGHSYAFPMLRTAYANISSRRTFVLWVSYFIPFLYIATVLAQYGYNYFNLFLKSLKNPDGKPTWSAQQVNAIPIGGGAINVLFGISQ